MKILVIKILVLGAILSCTTTSTATGPQFGNFSVFVLKNEESPQGNMLFEQLDIPREFATRAGVFSFKTSIIDKSINSATKLTLQGLESKKVRSFDEVLGIFEVRAQNPIKLSPRPQSVETLSLTFGLAELLSKKSWYGMSPCMYAIERALKKSHTKNGKIWIISETFDASGFFNVTLGVSAD